MVVGFYSLHLTIFCRSDFFVTFQKRIQPSSPGSLTPKQIDG